jgi:hypothetical protein
MYTASKTAKNQSCVKLIEYQKVYLLQYGHFMNVIKRFSYLFTHVFQTSPGNNFDKTFDIGFRIFGIRKIEYRYFFKLRYLSTISIYRNSLSS